jgi:hypothetical protein
VRLVTIFCGSALALGLAASAHAETVAVSELVNIPAGGVANVRLVCPEDFEISGEAQTFTSRWPTRLVHSDLHFLDRRGNVAQQDDAGAQELNVRNTLSTATDVSVVMLCAKRESPPVPSTATLQALGTTVLFGTCPTGMAPAGAVTNIDGSALRINYELFKYGTEYLDTLPDGNSTGAPTSIELFARNTLQSLQALRMTTRCVAASGLETIVQSVPTTPGSGFTLFVPVPDGYDFVGLMKDAGTDGAFTLGHIWLADGTVSSLPPYAETGGHAGRVKGIFLDGVDTRPAPAKAGARAYVGVLVRKLGTAQPPPNVVSVVEFYHAVLDHYFITSNAKEIGDLDSGVHKGWSRTGKSFRAYAVGSTGNTGRRPVCRAYGNPAAGLDSHFYSASPQECVATLTKFKDAWLLEASAVFEMELPDPSGGCAAGGLPIYRVWNNRTDSNHRYTTSIADRDAMVAKGYIKEGYGVNAVTLCAVP